jgi:hypothetical protein
LIARRNLNKKKAIPVSSESVIVKSVTTFIAFPIQKACLPSAVITGASSIVSENKIELIITK